MFNVVENFQLCTLFYTIACLCIGLHRKKILFRYNPCTHTTVTNTFKSCFVASGSSLKKYVLRDLSPQATIKTASRVYRCVDRMRHIHRLSRTFHQSKTRRQVFIIKSNPEKKGYGCWVVFTGCCKCLGCNQHRFKYLYNINYFKHYGLLYNVQGIPFPSTLGLCRNLGRQVVN